jgi:hypothetical protein
MMGIFGNMFSKQEKDVVKKQDIDKSDTENEDSEDSEYEEEYEKESEDEDDEDNNVPERDCNFQVDFDDEDDDKRFFCQLVDKEIHCTKSICPFWIIQNKSIQGGK